MGRSHAALVGLLLVGCSDGKVKTDALDFGAVKSTTWVERKLVDDAGDAHTHDFVLASVGGWCRTANKIYPDLGAAWARVLDTVAANPTDVTAQCEAKKAFYEEAAGLTEDVYRKGFTVMHIALRDPNEGADVPPFIGAYPTVGFDEVDRYIVGTIHQYETNPYRVYADEADCENKANFFESDALAKVEEQSGEWSLASGSGEVDQPGDDAYKVTIEGTLDDRSGKPAGEVTVKGRFDYCDLTWNGAFPEFL